MHSPPPRVLPQSAVLSERVQCRPCSATALSGIPSFSQVSVKIRMFTSMILLELIIHTRSSSILCTRERTLARRRLGRAVRCGAWVSLSLAPPLQPRFCLRSLRRLRGLFFRVSNVNTLGEPGCLTMSLGPSIVMVITSDLTFNPMSRSSCLEYNGLVLVYWRIGMHLTTDLQKLARPKAAACTRAAILIQKVTES